MADLATVILFGRLTQDIELRYTTGGTAVANISLAVNRRYKQGEDWKTEVSYFDVVAFGRRAETSAKYLSKGSQVLIEGNLVQRRWETPEGQKRSKIEVSASNVQFVGRSNDNQGQSEKPPSDTHDYEPPPVIDDDDIPF